MPAGRTETEELSVVNPTDYFVSTLVGVLRDRGHRGRRRAPSTWTSGAGGRATNACAASRRTRRRRSATSSSETNTDSNNLYAEHLLRTLGAYVYRGADLPTGSAFAGFAAAEPFLERIGIDPESFRVADGSGLSALNRLTPIGHHRASCAGCTSTPTGPRARRSTTRSRCGGYTGTLRNRYRAGDARGNVRAKTGYISGARTLSGYVTQRVGPPDRVLAPVQQLHGLDEPRQPRPGPDRRAAGRLRGPVARPRPAHLGAEAEGVALRSEGQAGRPPETPPAPGRRRAPPAAAPPAAPDLADHPRHDRPRRPPRRPRRPRLRRAGDDGRHGDEAQGAEGAPALRRQAAAPASPARRPTRSRCSSASRPSWSSTAATRSARPSSWPRTGGRTATCAASRRCWPSPRRTACCSSRAPAT